MEIRITCPVKCRFAAISPLAKLFNRVKNRKIYFLVTLFFLLFFILSFPVLAQTKLAAGGVNFIPQVSIPGTNVQQGKLFNITGGSIGDYIIEVYKYSISAVAILAVVMIMVAGFKMVTSRGNASAITSAKSQISSALVGLVIIIFAYGFLSFINPNLVIFKDLTIKHVTLEPFSTSCNYDIGEVSMSGIKNDVEERCDARCGGHDNAILTELRTTGLGEEWCCRCKGCIAGSIEKPVIFSDCYSYCSSLGKTVRSSGDSNCCLCANRTFISCEQITKDDTGKYNCDSGSTVLPDGTFQDGCGENLVCNNMIPSNKALACVCQLYCPLVGGFPARRVSCLTTGAEDTCSNSLGTSPKDCGGLLKTRICEDWGLPDRSSLYPYDGKAICCQSYPNGNPGLDFECVYK